MSAPTVSPTAATNCVEPPRDAEPQWVDVGAIADIPLRGARRVRTGDGPVAIFRTADGRVFALQDRCPHKQGPLSQGIVHDGCVTCPLHNWVISLETGQAQGADEGSVATYPLRVKDDRVFLGLTLGSERT